MPKKFGINSKSSEAKARKDAVKNAEQAQKEREAEDALWKDENKHVQRKQQRKDDKEKKKQEQLDRKQANKEAYEQEMNDLRSVKAQAQAMKVTRAEISSIMEENKDHQKKNEELMHDEKPLEENINRLITEGDSARTVEDAIAVLSINTGPVDRHPERRVKAAYEQYEEANIPRLKAENPNMRLSQLKQMLKKDWMKSPDNPMNQEFMRYNAKT